MDDTRPDPDALLASVQREESADARGKLKVFFGAAPGVGKTYAMLEAGRRAAKEGVDVVVGYVEPHVRPETQALLLGLDLLERRTITYKDRTFLEFDLEGALRRKPRLILVDELAHTNAAGSTHAKRWQDVEQLLDAGIDVYTTLNVQHLESLNDVVAHVTSVAVRETVPDSVFERADEIELVDIPPDDLIERLKEGKIYLPDQARRAIEHFFRKGNLIALRELALRKSAERVGDQALSYRQPGDLSATWSTSDRLLVCVGASPLSARLIRATRRMASAMHLRWTALHVEIDGAPAPSPEARARLEQNLRLAEQLGGHVATVVGVDFAQAVVDYAREHQATRIVIGKPRWSRWREWFRGAFVDGLIRRCEDIDVYVINGDSTDESPRLAPPPRPKSAWLPYVGATLTVVACTIACWGSSRLFAETNLVMIYLACVVAVSLRWGRGPSLLASVLSVAAFDLFFVPPFGTFAVSDTQYVITFAVMFATGMVVSELTARVRNQAVAAREREKRTQALYEMSRELSALPNREAVARTARRLIRESLDVESWIFAPVGGRLAVVLVEGGAPPARDEGVPVWVFEHRQPAGNGTQTLPGSEGVYLPLLADVGVVGVLGVVPGAAGPTLDMSQFQLLEAFAGQLAVVLQRCDLAELAETARLQIETERLRNSLLSAVSHDLRTPLATITGAASTLADAGEQLSGETRRELADSIVDEGDRLNRLVANLLDVTRIEAGAVELQLELQPIEEVIGVALRRVERQLRGRHVTTRIPADLPPVAIDALLVQQVLVNLLDNAVKFAPPGSEIDVEVRREMAPRDSLIVGVADRGAGIPAGEEERIFEKFHQADRRVRTGSGIGLAICKGIVTLHGGSIRAHNRPDGGALFEFTLPVNAPIGR